MNVHKIELVKRELSSKKSFVKNIRNKDEIPGIYYSHDSKESIPFSVNKKIMYEAFKAEVQVYQISVGSKNRDVIIKSVQYHPITEEMLHIDLYGVKMDQDVTVKVPLEITGQAIGLTSGGVLNQVLTEIEVSCLPGDIPQNISIDITDLDMGDAIRLAQIPVSDSVTIVGDDDNLVISIIQPTKEAEQSEEMETDDSIAGEASDTDSSDSVENNEENAE